MTYTELIDTYLSDKPVYNIDDFVKVMLEFHSEHPDIIIRDMTKLYWKLRSKTSFGKYCAYGSDEIATK